MKICSDSEELMPELKEKFLGDDTREEKIQILSLVPNNQLRSTATSFFNILEYLMRLTRETKREN